MIRSAGHQKDREDLRFLHYPPGYTATYGRHRRKVYATPKSPRRRNRYALSTIFLPRYPFGSPEDSTGAEEPRATNYHGSYLVLAIHKVNVAFSHENCGKLHSASGILLRRTAATSCALSPNVVILSRIIGSDQM